MGVTVALNALRVVATAAAAHEVAGSRRVADTSFLPALLHHRCASCLKSFLMPGCCAHFDFCVGVVIKATLLSTQSLDALLAPRKAASLSVPLDPVELLIACRCPGI